MADWYWAPGFWWPSIVLMGVFCVLMMVMMFRMMGRSGGMGFCGFGRWLDDATRGR